MKILGLLPLLIFEIWLWTGEATWAKEYLRDIHKWLGILMLILLGIMYATT